MLKPNDSILIKGPVGKCVFKDEMTKIGFLVGGIGITPAISIIEYINHQKLNTDITLVYGVHRYKPNCFCMELLP